MQILVSAWNSVTPGFIVNCFRKVGISVEDQEIALTDADGPFQELQEEIDTLRSLQSTLIPEDIDAAAAIDVDSDVAAVQPLLTDAEIISEYLGTDDIADEDNDDAAVEENEADEEPTHYPTKDELLEAIEVLAKFSLYSNHRRKKIENLYFLPSMFKSRRRNPVPV